MNHRTNSRGRPPPTSEADTPGNEKITISALAMSPGAWQKQKPMSQVPGVQKEVYGTMPDGREVHRYTLSNHHGLKARVMEYGAILLSMETPDINGKVADLTHGFDTLEGWIQHNTPYFGATVGRFGNRIAHGRFTLDGKPYKLATNNEPGGIPCALHGGEVGFDKVLWSGRIVDDQTVEFNYTSADGEEGYPGTLHIKVTYSLNDDDELKWHVSATTDAPTIINIIHHSYWNLTGDPTCSILDHQLTLNAPCYLPNNEGLIPTGEILPVSGTAMDFTTPHTIGERIDADSSAPGYDHAWILEKADGVRHVARLKDTKSGRTMDLFTDQPSIQVYIGSFLDGSVIGKQGVGYQPRTAVCLETQAYPDAPNKPDFPSCVLRPGETYTHALIHKFSTQ